MIDKEPVYEQEVDQVKQFQTDIIAYHEALKIETGLENPSIPIDDLFAWTDMEYHSNLRSAIWAISEKDWTIGPEKSSSERGFYLALSYTPGSFSFL